MRGRACRRTRTRRLAPLAVACLLLSLPAVAAAQPPNDNFANAQELTGLPTGATGTNVDATAEPGEPNHGGSGGQSVWYRWTAPATGNVTIDTCSSDFDTLLAVYTGQDVASLTGVTSNDDACDLQSRARFDATAGTTYMIAVDGLADTGNFTLRLAATPPPPLAQPGLYSGRTDFGEGIRFTLSSNRRRLRKLVISYDMNCDRGFTESRTVFGSIPVDRNGRFSLRVRFRFRPSGFQVATISGRLQAPRRATGSFSSRGRLPGVGRCRTPGRIPWSARHR